MKREEAIRMNDSGSMEVSQAMYKFNRKNGLGLTLEELEILAQKGIKKDSKNDNEFMYPYGSDFIHGLENCKAKAIAQNEIWMRIMPQLQGSEKQISWASKIRQQKLESYISDALQLLETKTSRPKTFETYKEIVLELGNALRNETSAKYWIENR